MKALFRIVILSLIVFFLYKMSKVQKNGPQIDPKIEAYVNEWKSNMTKAGIEWKEPFSRIKRIYFYNNSDDRLGYSTYTTNEVWISSSLLNRDPYLLRASLYHEMGHYIFQLDHSSGIMSDKSLDNNDPLYYTNNWQELVAKYIKECKASKANSFN